MSDTVTVLNIRPERRPTRVDRRRYQATREALLAVIPAGDSSVEFKELPRLVTDYLPQGELPGGGSILWHVTTVKLDLEARGLIERVPGAKPQRLRRVG